MIRTLKNKWIGISDDGMYEAVQDSLTLGSELRTSEFMVDDIRIDPNPKHIAANDALECYIHTLTIDQVKGKPRRRLLVITGYASSGVTFFPMFKRLRQEFEITTIDILGFGCSGRPTFRSHTVDGVKDWIRWQLRSWMDKTGYDKPEKGSYSMLCHSMGCYFAADWMIENHNKVD